MITFGIIKAWIWIATANNPDSREKKYGGKVRSGSTRGTGKVQSRNFELKENSSLPIKSEPSNLNLNNLRSKLSNVHPTVPGEQRKQGSKIGTIVTPVPDYCSNREREGRFQKIGASD